MVEIKEKSFLSTRRDTNFLPPLYTVIPRKLAVPNSRNPQTRGFCYLVAENPQIGFLLVKQHPNSRFPNSRSPIILPPIFASLEGLLYSCTNQYLLVFNDIMQHIKKQNLRQKIDFSMTFYWTFANCSFCGLLGPTFLRFRYLIFRYQNRLNVLQETV